LGAGSCAKGLTRRGLPIGAALIGERIGDGDAVSAGCDGAGVAALAV
jgi:hypothetical protein